MNKKLGLTLPLTLALSLSTLVACTNDKDNNYIPINKIENEKGHKMAGYWVEVNPEVDEMYPPDNYQYAMKIDKNGSVLQASLDPEEEVEIGSIDENGKIRYSQNILDQIEDGRSYYNYPLIRYYNEVSKNGVGVAELEADNTLKITVPTYPEDDKNVVSKDSEKSQTTTTVMKRLNQSELIEAKAKMAALKTKDDLLMASLAGTEWILDREEQTNATTGRTYPYL